MRANKEADDENNLVTPTSLALSLAPPRAPPHDTAHRLFLLSQNPRKQQHKQKQHKHRHEEEENHHDDNVPCPRYKIKLQKSRKMLQKLSKHKNVLRDLPHPHLPVGPELADRITRKIGTSLPLATQNKLRDDGYFRSIADTLVTVSVPSMAVTNPGAVVKYLGLEDCRTNIRYGKHRMQQMHLYEPPSLKENRGGRRRFHRGLLFFVHGGAWGSGLPWMYRLVALPFLEIGMSVVVVGYRTYPDANVDGQISDLELAASDLSRRRPDLWQRPTPPPPSNAAATNTNTTTTTTNNDDDEWLGVCLMGHSSGAHIALLMLVDRMTSKLDHLTTSTTTTATTNESIRMDFDSFVGLSGPYTISHHFDYEAARGVEELSPMKPACGHSRSHFDFYSPAIRFSNYLTTTTTTTPTTTPSCISPCNGMLLVHGIEDSTVPFTATAEAAMRLRLCGITSCEELYVAKTGHQDAILHIMLG
eukprot:CAMPEP_0195528016 /NCGR_PEP_ID=MMETSP0794_2-20130614/29985_1 /TAXON_ID=515487 /ORGANISM="Stephanopyxis turris, Strain CCMP 815" /LENGTH=473 /DNA_ID=CAMNT_0040659059 /DNA_START=108 /DNA_END=1526 /DNA_ORIENTATION=+